MRTKTLPLLLLAGLAAQTAVAQQSASYRLREHATNAGGHPAAAVVLSSASFRVKLDAIGDPVARTGLASATFRSDAGFPAAYPPPGEVGGVIFANNKTTITWTPERSVGLYEVYRDTGPGRPGDVVGTCFDSAVTVPAASDTASPAVGAGWYYLVTARNRLAEEGTKGTTSGGVPRPNPTPCP